MVAAHRVDVSGGKAGPERRTVRFLAQRRSPGVFRRVRLGEAFPGQVQVQRPGLNVDRQAGSPGLSAAVQCGGGRQVHDVDGRSGARGDPDGLVDRGDLGGDRAGVREMRDRVPALRDELLARLPKHRAILAVQQCYRAGRLRGAGRRQQGTLVGCKVRVGQEHLDARVPAFGEGGDLTVWQRAWFVQDRVEKPVDRSLLRGAVHLPGDRDARRLHGAVAARRRIGHIADRGDAAGDSGPRPGPEVVYPDWEIAEIAEALVHEVRVRVDPAGKREQPGGGDLVHARHLAADLGNLVAGDTEVRDLLAARRDHSRAAYYDIETHRSIVTRPAATSLLRSFATSFAKCVRFRQLP